MHKAAAADASVFVCAHVASVWVTVCRLSESERRRSSFEGVGGSLLSAAQSLSTSSLHYLTSSPCLLTVTLMDPERARARGQRPEEKHQSHLIVF